MRVLCQDGALVRLWPKLGGGVDVVETNSLYTIPLMSKKMSVHCMYLALFGFVKLDSSIGRMLLCL